MTFSVHVIEYSSTVLFGNVYPSRHSYVTLEPTETFHCPTLAVNSGLGGDPQRPSVKYIIRLKSCVSKCLANSRFLDS